MILKAKDIQSPWSRAHQTDFIFFALVLCSFAPLPARPVWWNIHFRQSTQIPKKSDAKKTIKERSIHWVNLVLRGRYSRRIVMRNLIGKPGAPNWD